MTGSLLSVWNHRLLRRASSEPAISAGGTGGHASTSSCVSWIMWGYLEDQRGGERERGRRGMDGW